MKRTLSRKRMAAFVGVALMLGLVVLLGVGEIAARVAGYEPWQRRDADITVEPGGKLFIKHPKLGYQHIPGEYVVRLATGFEFKMTHLDSGLRITRPLADYDGAEERPEIWILGCSVTHGWTVDDDQTYPWQLQKLMPRFEIVNFGVNGYGTLHSLIQLREALHERKKPAVVVLAYAGFHDKRNTFLRSRRKLIATWNKLGPLVQPFARLDDDGKLQITMATVEYEPFPLMQVSALAHLLEQNYNSVEDELLDSRSVTRAIVLEMRRVAREHGVPLAVVGVHTDERTRELLQFCREHDIPAASLKLNLALAHNQNRPHDDHPNPKAHRKYARNLHAFLVRTELR